MDDDALIFAKLDRASELMFNRDRAIVDELWSDGFQLIGSEDGETAFSRPYLEGLVDALFKASFQLRWFWDRKSIRIENDIAWVFAQGRLEFVYPDRIIPVAYRLVAIFKRSGNDWVWRLYSGSEPIPRRPLQ